MVLSCRAKFWPLAGLLFGASVAPCLAKAAPPTRSELCEQLRTSENTFFGRQTPAATPHALAQDHLQRGRFAEAIAAAKTILETDQASLDARTRAHWLSGLAHLRLGETSNCQGHAAAGDVCIVPLSNGALHHDPAPARRAAHHFRQVLSATPRDAGAAWLLNLASTLGAATATVPERWALQLSSATSAERPFRNLARPLALDRVDLAGGAAVEDFDGDGLLDLFSSSWDPCLGPSLWLNNGRGGFDDRTEEWGLRETAGGLNLFTTDYDNDGRIDVFLTRGAWLLGEGRIANSLLRNELSEDGTPRFRDVTVEVGLDRPPAPTQAATWGDFDQDGLLDLYLANEATAAYPHASQLFLNRRTDEGHRFEDVAQSVGVTNLRYSKAAAAGDIDNDGDLDLYVSNFGLNRLYLNRLRESGTLSFEDQAAELGVTEPAVQSFATWFFDFDNDGDLDLFVADYRQRGAAVAASYFPEDSWIGRAPREAGGRPLLYRNLLAETGHLGFVESGAQLGLTRPAMPMGANFADLDGDGKLDIYLGTGEPNLASQFPNQAYLNRGDRFEDATWTLGLGHVQKGHGVAFGDLDGDGDQDLLHQLGGFYPGDTAANALFENLSQSASWVTLRLQGVQSNRAAIGARVRIDLTRQKDEEMVAWSIRRVVGTGGSFGVNSLQLEIGLGSAEQIERAEVQWPAGSTQVYTDLEVRSIYRLIEGEATAKKITAPRLRLAGSSEP